MDDHVCPYRHCLKAIGYMVREFEHDDEERVQAEPKGSPGWQSAMTELLQIQRVVNVFKQYADIFDIPLDELGFADRDHGLLPSEERGLGGQTKPRCGKASLK